MLLLYYTLHEQHINIEIKKNKAEFHLGISVLFGFSENIPFCPKKSK